MCWTIEGAGDQWSKVRGPHGFGVANEAGKELLGFSLPSRQLLVTHGSARRSIK